QKDNTNCIFVRFQNHEKLLLQYFWGLDSIKKEKTKGETIIACSWLHNSTSSVYFVPEIRKESMKFAKITS
ncbi:MAG TPA: hypothetical protein VE076_01210, partial [Nitrososphaeraceae archaeon]|nr:hypothetical protein [Nitrososphaeraceae archaeon]